MMSSVSDRFVALDSWRGIAACCVALSHFKMGVNSHVGMFSLFAKAWLFVDFFFVLSGFVIFANYAQRLLEGFGFWRFMLLRFGRLYPLHLFVLLVFIGFEVLQLIIPQLGGLAIYEPFSQVGESPGYIISSLFLVQSLGLYDDGTIAFNGPSWSISTEFYAYAVFALLLILFKKNIKMALLLVFAFSGAYLYFSGSYLTSTLQYGFIRCLYGFSAGALLWYFYGHLKGWVSSFLSNFAVLVSAEIGVICFLVAFFSYISTGAYQMLAPLVFASIIFVFSFESGVVSKLLKCKFFVLLGTLSYSIYMVHSFIAGKAESAARYIAGHLPWDVTSVSHKGQELLGANAWQGDAVTLVYLLLVVACSLITYKYIETPGREYFRRLTNSESKK